MKQTVPSNKIEPDVGSNERVRQDPHAEGDLTGCSAWPIRASWPSAERRCPPCQRNGPGPHDGLVSLGPEMGGGHSTDAFSVTARSIGSSPFGNGPRFRDQSSADGAGHGIQAPVSHGVWDHGGSAEVIQELTVDRIDRSFLAVLQDHLGHPVPLCDSPHSNPLRKSPRRYEAPYDG